MDRHPDVSPIAFILGSWEGEGVGVYPTIDDFSYREEVSFVAPPGKPFVHYSQRTWRSGDHAESGAPLHTEAGYLRPINGSEIEAVIAQPTGFAEVHSGTIDGLTIALKSATVARTETAKDVRSVERILVAEGDELTYELWMGAVGQDHQVHLRATLHRVR